MMTQFLPLATLRVAHGYFAMQRADVQFVPTPRTARLLRGARVLGRAQDGRLTLSFAARSGAALQSLTGRVLHLLVVAAEVRVSLATAPLVSLAGTAVGPFGCCALVANSSSPTALDAPVPATLAAAEVQYQPLLAARPVRLRLVDGDGVILEERTTSQATSSYDFRQLEPGSYLIQESSGSQTESARLFVDPEVTWERVPLAVVALKVDAGFYVTPPEFELRLAPREERLRYYVVCRGFSPNDVAELNVADEGAAFDSRPQVQFERFTPPFPPGFVPPEQVVDAEQLAQGTARLAVFQSQAVVALRERGLHRIRLRRNATTLIEQLPAPPAHRPGGDVIVHLAKP